MAKLLAPGGPLTDIVLNYIGPKVLYVYARLLPDDEQLAHLTRFVTAQAAAEHAAETGWLEGLDLCLTSSPKKLCIISIMRACIRGKQLVVLDKVLEHVTWEIELSAALSAAAEYGQLEAMNKIYARKKSTNVSAMRAAAVAGQLMAMNKLYHWGVSHMSLRWALGGVMNVVERTPNQQAAIEKLRSWGAA